MDTTLVAVAGEIEPGAPLHLTEETIHVPVNVIEEDTELVYKLRSDLGELRAGTYLITQLRSRVHTGELVVVRKGEDIYLGRWWGKHGLREVRDNANATIVTDPEVIGSINHVLSFQ